MIDRYLLRYFLAVVDHGTFSRAASHCGVSQPTLSVGIAKLERTLGATLFSRSNQRVQLTDAGSRFLVHARRIENEFNLAQQAMTTATDAPLLRVGILQSVPVDAVARAIAASRNQSKDVRPELIYATEREIIGHLARGRIDVALTLVARGSTRFIEQPLMTEGYRLAMSMSHPYAHCREVTAEELADNPMIVRRHCEALSETSRHFTERGIRPHLSLRTQNDERVLALVAAGLGITVMPASFHREDVARPRLAGFFLKRVIGFSFAHHAEHYSDTSLPLLRALADEVSALGAQTPRRGECVSRGKSAAAEGMIRPSPSAAKTAGATT